MIYFNKTNVITTGGGDNDKIKMIKIMELWWCNNNNNIKNRII